MVESLRGVSEHYVQAGVRILTIGRCQLLEIHKSIVLDEAQNPVAVQIPIEDFRRLEDIMENYGLSKLMDETLDDDQLSVEEAKQYYQSLK